MAKLVYYFLRVYVRIALRLFYRRYTVHGRNHRTIASPFIVVSNHPNTLMDALIVASQLRQRIGFLGNASLFRDARMAAVLKFLGVIPIYRKQDLLPGETMENNQDSFQKAFDHLSNGGAFLVFPEGTSIAERKLRELRTGTARMALGYEESKQFRAGMKVLPVSINYSSSTHFRTRVHVNLNEPVVAKDYESEYQNDPRQAVRLMTQAINDRLIDGLVVLDDHEQERMFHQAVRLLRENLDGPTDLRKPSRKGFEEEKATAEAIRRLAKEKPETYQRLKVQLQRWFELLDKLGLRQHILGERIMRMNPNLLMVLTAVGLTVGFPAALLGIVAGFIPYQLSGWLPPKIAKDIEYRAPIMMMLGLILFPLFYALETLIWWLTVGSQWHWAYTLALFFSLPVCGMVALLWRDNWERLVALVRLAWMKGRKRGLGDRLTQLRRSLLSELRAALHPAP